MQVSAETNFTWNFKNTIYLPFDSSKCDVYKDGKAMNKAEELAPYWQMYKMKYVAFATTTHFVERSVKIYNFCSNKSRGEERVTQFAICYNIVHDVNQLTKELMIAAKLERGQIYKDDSKVKPVGKRKNQTILQNVVDRHNKLASIMKNHPHLLRIHKEILETISISADILSFKKQRIIDSYNEAMPLMEKERKKNKIENKTGVDHTPAVKKEVRFFSVKDADKEGIIEELSARGFTDVSGLKNITQLKEKLKDVHMEQENIKKDKKEIKFFTIKSKYDWSHLVA